MRKSWTIWKDEEAVSPVIATILMVAITVVLAAVLYVMVTGLMGGGGGGTPAPALTFTVAPSNVGVWTAEAAVSRAAALGSYRLSLVNETSGDIIIEETALANTFNRTAAGVTLVFLDDASPASQQLNGGDKFRISGIVSPNRYTLNIVWTLSGAIIQSVILPPT